MNLHQLTPPDEDIYLLTAISDDDEARIWLIRAADRTDANRAFHFLEEYNGIFHRNADLLKLHANYVTTVDEFINDFRGYYLEPEP